MTDDKQEPDEQSDKTRRTFPIAPPMVVVAEQEHQD
jgi:hypothetical protein